MEPGSIPRDNITIAWATPVSLAHLGARLETYAETKAAITTFGLAARRHMLASNHILLPEEIISIIVSKVRDVVFEARMETWTKISRCLAKRCTLAAFSSDESDDESMEEVYFEDDHQEHMREYCKKLSNLDSKSSTFAQCVQVSSHERSLHCCIPSYLVTLPFTELSRLTTPSQRSSRKTSAYALTSWCKSSTNPQQTTQQEP